MSNLDHLKTLPRDAANESLVGLTSMFKVHTLDGLQFAFWSVSKLDLDTDGKRDVGIRYESTHQDETTLDPSGSWLSSNRINYIVLPGGFEKRHEGVKPGCLATVMYRDKVAHAVYADVGPMHKFGEGSLALHRSLGFERVHDGKISDVGIDDSVSILLYLKSDIGHGPFVQADIDRACAPYWAKFSGEI